MKKTKTTIQKPIDLDIHLKYRCSNTQCGYYHWLSLIETQTKNFKVVCDCGTVFKPKRVSRCKILYKTAAKKHPKHDSTTTETKPSVDILDKCSKILSSYGFTETEIQDLVEQAYDKCATTDIVVLIKYILQNWEK